MLAAQMGGVNYRFKSEDGHTFIELNNSFVSLTTERYTRWEEYSAFIDKILDAFVSIYVPSYFTRIGLRYINIINKNNINLAEIPWSKLLSKYICGELGADFIENNIDEFLKFVRVRPPGSSLGFLLQNGIVKDETNSKNSYAIDFDFYDDNKTEINRARAVTDALHGLSGRAFRWAITDELHNALEPSPVD